jgi:hypothetical protein
MYGAGKPKAAYDRAMTAVFAILAVIRAVADHFLPARSDFHDRLGTYVDYYSTVSFTGKLKNQAV